MGDMARLQMEHGNQYPYQYQNSWDSNAELEFLNCWVQGELKWIADKNIDYYKSSGECT